MIVDAAGLMGPPLKCAPFVEQKSTKSCVSSYLMGMVVCRYLVVSQGSPIYLASTLFHILGQVVAQAQFLAKYQVQA